MEVSYGECAVFLFLFRIFVVIVSSLLMVSYFVFFRLSSRVIGRQNLFQGGGGGN